MESPSSSRHRRIMQERLRRMRMRDLYNRLASLIPRHPSRSRSTVSELVTRASFYINHLKERVEEGNRRKAELMRGSNIEASGEMASGASLRILPRLNITTWDQSTLEVNFITGMMNKNFMLYEVISVLQEEGAEVVSVNLHNAGNRAIYTIKSQAFSSRIGIEISRIHERLKDLIL